MLTLRLIQSLTNLTFGLLVHIPIPNNPEYNRHLGSHELCNTILLCSVMGFHCRK